MSRNARETLKPAQAKRIYSALLAMLNAEALLMPVRV